MRHLIISLVMIMVFATSGFAKNNVIATGNQILAKRIDVQLSIEQIAALDTPFRNEAISVLLKNSPMTKNEATRIFFAIDQAQKENLQDFEATSTQLDAALQKLAGSELTFSKFYDYPEHIMKKLIWKYAHKKPIETLEFSILIYIATGEDLWTNNVSM